MLKTYKYRLYFTPKQEEEFKLQCDGARFIYNLGLETKITSWVTYNKSLSFFDLANQLTELKKSKEGAFLKNCHSQVLQCSLKNLDSAFNNFYKGKKFPKFKSKKYSKESIQFPQRVSVDFKNNKIKLPKFKNVNCIFSRLFKGDIKTCTITKTKTNKYFISILVDNQDLIPNKTIMTFNNTIGIDVGIKNLLTLSDGTVYSNLNFLKRSLKRLKIENTKLSRRFKKGIEIQSKSYLKQKQIVALLHEKISNQRKDYLHKITTELVKKYDTIIIEDLDISKMIKNPNFALAISDVGWGYFSQFLQYKANWYGKNIIKINKFAPSSKICSNCGKINKYLKLSDRHWKCNCGILHDRDINAAINIKNFGLRMQPLQDKINK